MILAWDSPAQVNWSEHVTSDQVATTGAGVTTRRFETLLLAVRFVMEDLDANPHMQIGVYPEREAPSSPLPKSSGPTGAGRTRSRNQAGSPEARQPSRRPYFTHSAAKLAKNWSAVFLATPSMRRDPIWAIFPPTLAWTS